MQLFFFLHQLSNMTTKRCFLVLEELRNTHHVNMVTWMQSSSLDWSKLTLTKWWSLIHWESVFRFTSIPFGAIVLCFTQHTHDRYLFYNYSFIFFIFHLTRIALLCFPFPFVSIYLFCNTCGALSLQSLVFLNSILLFFIFVLSSGALVFVLSSFYWKLWLFVSISTLQ